MSITVCTGKLHRVTVTAARPDYEGSITLDPVLMEAAGIVPLQLLHINSMANAMHWETYAIPGTPGSGEVCLNGCPARLFQPGDEIVILSLEQLSREEARRVQQKVVHVDKRNRQLRVEIKQLDAIPPDQVIDAPLVPALDVALASTAHDQPNEHADAGGIASPPWRWSRSRG
jgi:aspartate 1-decarboxylase